MSLAFIYYDVIVLYAIINAIRGKGIWTTSVKEAATGSVSHTVPMVQPQFNAASGVQYQNCGTYPPNAPPTQPYNAYPQQVHPQAAPAQPYNAYPQQLPPQGASPPQYNAYPQQAPPQGSPTITPGQNQPYNYPTPPGALQQHVSYAGYSPSPTSNNAPLPPQPNYNSYPVDGSQAQLPLPGGYQRQSMPQQQQLYGSHQPVPV